MWNSCPTPWLSWREDSIPPSQPLAAPHHHAGQPHTETSVVPAPRCAHRGPGRPPPGCSHLMAGFSNPRGRRGRPSTGTQPGGKGGQGGRNCPGVSQADNGSGPAATLRSNMAAAPLPPSPPPRATAPERTPLSFQGFPPPPQPSTSSSLSFALRASAHPVGGARRILGARRRGSPGKPWVTGAGPGRRGVWGGAAVPASPAPVEGPRPPPLLPSRQAEPSASRRRSGASARRAPPAARPDPVTALRRSRCGRLRWLPELRFPSLPRLCAPPRLHGEGRRRLNGGSVTCGGSGRGSEPRGIGAAAWAASAPVWVRRHVVSAEDKGGSAPRTPRARSRRPGTSASGRQPPAQGKGCHVPLGCIEPLWWCGVSGLWWHMCRVLEAQKRGLHPGLKFTGCVFGDHAHSRAGIRLNIPTRLCILAYFMAAF